MSPIARIRLPIALVEAMKTTALAAWPLEACGLILGQRRPEADGDDVTALLFEPTRNDAEDPLHGYVVPPLELLAADRRAREMGLEIVGIWHSHPDAPPLPSRRDTAEAWEGYAYGIHAARADTTAELRFFTLQDGALRPIPLVVIADSPGDET